MNTVVGLGSNSVTKLIRTDKDTMVKKTTYYNDKSLDNNQQLKKELKGSKHKLGIHDNADTRAAFSFPSVEEYQLFKIKHPETYELIISGNEYERIKGAKQLSFIHPEYIIYTRF